LRNKNYYFSCKQKFYFLCKHISAKLDILYQTWLSYTVNFFYRAMTILDSPTISGLKLLKPTLFNDERGYFFESYNSETFKKLGICDDFLQDNQSCSKKNVIRGLHFQVPPFAQAKLVRVVKGAALDVAVDLRKDSATYGQYFSVLLSEENKLQFYIPEGFAHGFAVLEENTIFAYKCSNIYHKESERTILFNDIDFNIDWQISNPIVSEKDLQGIRFKDFITPF